MTEKKRGFLSRLFGKLDEKLEEKSAESCGCCTGPRKDDKKKGCC